jgi:hypothetical protein
MRRLSFACEENSDQPPCPSTLRLNPLCVTSVCLGRVPVTGPLTALATVPLSVLHQNCLGEGALSGHGDPRVSGVAETWPTRDWAPAFVRPARGYHRLPNSRNSSPRGV